MSDRGRVPTPAAPAPTEGATETEGTVYLLHFSAPVRGARHYVGWTSRQVERRVERHQLGQGARLTRQAHSEGVTMTLARTWAGTMRRERALKSGRLWRGRGLCPLCASEVAGQGHR